MLCLTLNDTIVVGPTSWPDPAIRQALYIAGYTEAGGVLRAPTGEAVTSFPEAAPASPLDLGHGYRLLPAVEADESAPEGKMLARREPVVLADRVELRPVWEDVPAAPPAPETPPPSRIMSRYDFRTKVLTFPERVAMDNSVIPELVTLRNDLQAAENVDLDEVAKYRAVMLATGLATEARVDQILAGQGPEAQ